jgi:trk system potassium uptake protein
MRTVVLGCGRVGSGVARELASRGCRVTVVDDDTSALDRLGEGFNGHKVAGSALRADVLDAAGVRHADALAVVTGDDQVNAVVAMAARRTLRVPIVVARLYDPKLAEIHQRLGIRTIAPVTWGIQRIADLIVAGPVGPSHALGSGQVDLVEVVVPALLDRRSVAELEVEGELRVVAVTRHGRTVLSTPGRELRTGDLVHVAVAGASRGRLDTLLGHG